MILLVGKTCAGKDTILNELINKGMKPIISYTTRPPRDNEIDGVSYHFISEKDFIEKKDNNFFAETVSYNTDFNKTWFYGSAIRDLTDDKAIIVNPEGLREIKKIKSLNPVAFYITASEETIWNRLVRRGDDLEKAKRRLLIDNKDFENVEKDIDFMLNNSLGLSPSVLADIILNIYKKITTKGGIIKNANIYRRRNGSICRYK